MARMKQLPARGYVCNQLPDGSWRLDVLMLAEGVRYTTVRDTVMRMREVPAIVAELQINDPVREPTSVEVVRTSLPGALDAA